ncbi:MAG: GNAT family N-acetyltransferase [Pirellulales bacterium]
MTVADVSLGMRLKEQAGWNQVEADWRRFLAMQPDGCFVAELDGAPVGTAVGCVFGLVAWVAMVLVDEAVRGRGIGRALVEHAVSFVEGQGARSVRLDATPLGRPVYEKLGFVPQFELTRYAATLDPRSCQPHASLATQASLRLALQDDYEAIFALDYAATYSDRRKFLALLFNERPAQVYVVDRERQVEGYLTIRHGSAAVQLGPCIANAEAGERLFGDACRRLAGARVYLDVPCSHDRAVRLADSAGLEVQRTLTRMCRGAQVCEDVERLWASSGPELG